MKRILDSLLCICLAVGLAGCGKKRGSVEPGRIAVRVEKPSPFRFRDQVMTQGVIEAVDHATLSTLIPGRLEELNVKEGDRVRKGMVLFRSDRKTLENRCILAGEALKMARERQRTREADLELAKVNFEKAAIDYKRSGTLLGTRAVSQDSFESAELKYRAGQLTIRQAEAALSTARAEVSFAEATLEIARKHLADSAVAAPYDGVITAKYRQENEFCGAGTPVLKIERPGRKRIAAVLSAVHYPRFSVGATKALLAFRGREIGQGTVTVLAPAIDPASRTFEVKADLPGEFAFPSGTLCDVRFLFGERDALSVPEGAVLFRQNGRFAVFAAEKDVAREYAVTPGTTQNGRTELRDAGTLRDLRIIVSGQYFVSDGSALQVTEK